jgi:DsbC/DsbD-like thiol-disulfide interchange protein
MSNLPIVMFAYSFALCLALTGPAQAADSDADDSELVSTELLASAAEVEPGNSFWVGVRFDIKPHWHIYWLNPGDSGMATSIDWALPDGWKVGNLQWPVPIKFTQPGDIVGYGYENQVVLMAKVTVPKDAKLDQTYEIAAESNWLVCKDVCIPGESKRSTRITVSQTPKASNAPLFEAAKARLPVTDGVKADFMAEGPTHWVRFKFDQPVAGLASYPHSDALKIVQQPAVDPKDPREAMLACRFARKQTDAAGFLLVWQDAKGRTFGQNVNLK